MMEKRERVHVRLARREIELAERHAGVVREAAVVQQRALWEAGRARRVLDLDRVVRTDLGEQLRGGARSQKCLEVAERDRLAQPGKLAADRLERLRHGVAAELRHQEDA